MNGPSSPSVEKAKQKGKSSAAVLEMSQKKVAYDDAKSKEVRADPGSRNAISPVSQNVSEDHMIAGMEAPQAANLSKKVVDLETKVTDLQKSLEKSKAQTRAIHAKYIVDWEAGLLGAAGNSKDGSSSDIPGEEMAANLRNRIDKLEADKSVLQRNLTNLEVKYSKVSESGAYPENSATPTHVSDVFRTLSFAVQSLCRLLAELMPEHSDQMSQMRDKYSHVSFQRTSHFPTLALKADVMNILFENFENESFIAGGHSVYPDPVKRKKEFFELFEDFRTHKRGPDYDFSKGGWADNDFVSYYRRTKTRVWQIVGMENSGEQEGPDLEFRKAAQNVWTLHLLSFSFEPPASLFRVRSGAKFEKNFMKAAEVVEVDQDSTKHVAFMMTPGLRVDRFSAIKSEIYPVLE